MPDYRNINVRSPFFTQKATTGSVVNCEIRLWKGDVVTDLPTNYTYLLSKEPTAGKSTFEVAELARDFLSHNTDLSSGFAWMQIILKDTIVADDTFTYLVSEGYSLSTEGLQSSNVNNLIPSIDLQNDWYQSTITTTSGVTSPIGDTSAYNILTQSGGGYISNNSIQNITEGSDITFSVYLKGSGVIKLLVQENGGDYSSYFFRDITLSGTWVRYEVSGTTLVDGNSPRIVMISQSIINADVWTPLLTNSEDAISYDFVGLPTATINGLANSSRIMVADGGTNSIPYFSNSDGTIYTVTDYFSDELITNGGFDIDTDWINVGQASISEGSLNFNGGSNSKSSSFSPITGKNYLVSFEVISYTSGNISIYTGDSGVNLSGNINSKGYYSYNYTQTATVSNNLNFNGNFIGSIDNISVVEVNPDAEVIPVTTTSTTMVKTKLVDDNDTTIDFDFNGDIRKVFVDVLRCSKFDAVNLLYVNKFGFKTKFPFILKSTEKISVESDSFSRSTVDYGALTLNTSSHSSRKRIKDTKQSFVLNSDWISEYYVNQFEELMLSEYVWLEKGSLTLPVNITTSKLDKKTHINDKLINYSIEVETASNYINTIR